MARGKLRIYLGAAPGVGKTFAMLDEGWRRFQRGTDVVIGYVETHSRPKTIAQLRDLPVIPRREIEYRGQHFEEMDLEGILERKPGVVLIDELAHTNVPGSRHEKRWQDVEEILDAGLDVITTVNVQHLASLNDVVEQIAGVTQRETVPDAVVRAADQIELVDMSPEALRRRMAHGNIYPPERVDAALAHYFRVGNLNALRELALLWVADRVDDELQSYRERYGISQPWETRERVVVALTGAPNGDRLLRRGSRMAARAGGELVGVHVRATDGLARSDPQRLEEQHRLLSELGGRYAEVTGADVATALVEFARAENASQLVLGATRQSRWSELARGSIINRVVRAGGDIDIHVISSEPHEIAALPRPARPRRLVALSRERRLAGWLLGTVGIAGLALVLTLFRSSLELPGTLLILLLGVVIVAVVGGIAPAAIAAVLALGLGDFYFTVPFHTFRMTQPSEIAALIVFGAVAAVVSALVDRLARRSSQINRSQAEAEALARLAGGAVLAAAEPLPNLVSELRRTFALDAVAVLEADGDGWRPIAVAGAPVPERPEDAPVAAELAPGTVLVLSGTMLSAEDRRLLGAFVAQLRLVQERAQLQAQAASATELEEANSLRTALLAAVSHDLRTPLAAIKAAATSLLSREVDWPPEQVQDFVKMIDVEADRLTHLVSNLLDMSRLQTGALRIVARPTKLEDVIYSAVGTLGAGAARVVIDGADPSPVVDTDAGLLERAIANIVDNALAWSPEGDVVRVEAALIGDHADVRVIDHGPGIPRDQREQVFEPFQRLGDGRGNAPDGVGLGLAVARGFVHAVGGDLTIDDTPNGGTTVVLALPVGQS
jgi:two-component system, OmpR family, sensor histidine kinase KdpD